MFNRNAYKVLSLLVIHQSSCRPTEDAGMELIMAAWNGKNDKIQQLIAAGADINAKGYGGEGTKTPLFYAAMNGHKDTVELMIKAGADVNARSEDDQDYHLTPLIYAAEKGHTEVVEMLINNGADINAEEFQCTSSQGLTKAIELLKNNGNPDEFECIRLTALAKAVFNGHTDTVEMLINNGAAKGFNSVVTQDGTTALMIAALQGYKKIVEMLIDGGADVSAKDKRGDTALGQATYRLKLLSYYSSSDNNSQLKDYVEIVEMLQKADEANKTAGYGSE